MKPAELINLIIEKREQAGNPIKKYLEIGCQNNVTFNKVNIPPANKIGVDPNFGGTHRMTSDEFFRGPYSNNMRFDLVFIDGLHDSRQVIKDTSNSAKCLHRDGIILIHDCLPQEYEHQLSVEEFKNVFGIDPHGGKVGRVWCGDVWKAIVAIRSKSNWPDICTLDEDWGFGIVKWRKSTAEVLWNVPLDLDWELYLERREELLRIVNLEEALKFMDLK